MCQLVATSSSRSSIQLYLADPALLSSSWSIGKRHGASDARLPWLAKPLGDDLAGASPIAICHHSAGDEFGDLPPSSAEEDRALRSDHEI